MHHLKEADISLQLLEQTINFPYSEPDQSNPRPTITLYRFTSHHKQQQSSVYCFFTCFYQSPYSYNNEVLSWPKRILFNECINRSRTSVQLHVKNEWKLLIVIWNVHCLVTRHNSKPQLNDARCGWAPKQPYDEFPYNKTGVRSSTLSVLRPELSVFTLSLETLYCSPTIQRYML